MSMQPYLDIFSSPKEDGSVSGFEYVEYLPNNFTTDVSTTSWEIQHKNVDDWILPARSYIMVQGKLLKNDGSDFSLGHNAALVNNGFSVFERASYHVDGNQVSHVDYVPQATLMRGLVDFSKDHVDSVGSMTNFIPDQNTGMAEKGPGTVDAASTSHHEPVVPNADYNEGFAKRSNNAIASQTTLWLPVKDLFGFCATDKVSRGARHVMKLERAKLNDMIHNTAADAGRFVLSKVSWWMPIVKPSLPIQADLESKLQAGATIPWDYKSVKCYRSNEADDAGRTWRVTNQSVKPMRILVGLQLAAKQNSAAQNNMIFDQCALTEIQLRVNGKQYPQEALKVNYEAGEEDWARAYASFVSAGGKGFDPDTGCLIDYKTFGELYPIYAFDLTTADESLFGNSADIEVRVTLRSAPGSYAMYCVIESESSVLFKGAGGGRMVIDQL